MKRKTVIILAVLVVLVLALLAVFVLPGLLRGPTRIKVGVVGDIGHSRVCGSLIPALKIMGCEVTVVAPPTLLPARPDILGADHVTTKLDEALPDYAAMRRWHVRIYQGMSAAFTPMYQSGSRGLPVLRDLVLAPCSGLPGVRHMLTRLVAGTMIPPLAGTDAP